MERSAVILKSNPRGLVVELPGDLSFEDLIEAVKEKFRSSAAFFGHVSLALSFTGRTLSQDEEGRLVEAITQNSSIEVLCLLDEEGRTDQAVSKAENALENKSEDDFIYRGSLRARESLKSDQSVVILGDVNPGAAVTSRGSIIVLGCCMGTLVAGSEGDNSCFAAALTMKPAMIRIGEHAARSAIVKKVDTGEYPIDPQIIYVKGEHLKFEPITRETLQDYLTDEKDPI